MKVGVVSDTHGQLNPGGAGRRRMHLPRSMALLHIGEQVKPEIIILEEA